MTLVRVCSNPTRFCTVLFFIQKIVILMYFCIKCSNKNLFYRIYRKKQNCKNELGSSGLEPGPCNAKNEHTTTALLIPHSCTPLNFLSIKPLFRTESLHGRPKKIFFKIVFSEAKNPNGYQNTTPSTILEPVITNVDCPFKANLKNRFF